ncbi:multifunctional oxoglutarate decarboxylase/oxoglutarate dehydrogenase thiamine pyrophosphate-binding subunit/dihydrolipoyllysine-residue succinyltransferase subunit [Rubrivirga marina]|uniref:oxoglutarate dehydrogenase (succinyl-transferring) n=1 Tax=Rubrivirga marina TaxID=1196024 RepID=A0A271J4H0_9BACT|nr:multifunctional oxoglutarate decarboxylase/oxoglutarate dehydrogenase thiamine pyrophosphate-binding subunit/dihydrolipoyllysine-residue succinyltransferase subunit [Rubrivirga marina]PAP78416.1 alpha-ketoglutarate decarboxylase [Rubrivirga marina]
MFGFNSGYVEDLYAQYRQNPESVSASWREFFADFDPGPTYSASIGAEASDSDTKARMLAGEPADGHGATPATPASGDGAPAAAPRPTPPAPAAPTPPASAPRPSTSNGAPAGGDGAPTGPVELPARLAAPDISLPEGAEASAIKGVGARIVENMEASLTIPTATSVREIAVKLLSENRRLINRHQQRVGGDKVTFTHLIAYAIVRAMEAVPSMKAAFREHDGEPERIDPASTSFGLAIDIEKRGKRQLLVPNIKKAEALSFAEFLGAYNDVVKRALGGKLQLDDFAGTTATLTNPGGIGTQMSVPRLMPGQSVIVAVGGIGYPPEYEGMDPAELSRLGLSPVMTMTSTYDHRVIQGAESGEFLNVIATLLQGGRGFYEEVFQSLGLHIPPFRGKADSTPALGKAALGSGAKASKVEKQARVYELIRAYRVRGHLLADTNPLGYEPRNHTELDPASYGLTVWDLDRTFFTGGMAGVTGGGLAGNHSMTLRDILDTLWDTYTGHVGSEFMHLSSPEEKRWLIERIEPQQFREPIDTARKKRIFEKLNEAEALEQFIHTKYIGHKRFSLEGAETMIPLLDAVISDAADQETEDVVIGMAHRGRLNVLTNILGKPYDKVFSEFEGTVDPDAVHGSGDVKYHLGQTGTHTSPNGSETQLTLASNPSHLEAVNPVVEGMARAMQQRIVEDNPDASEKRLRDRVLPILVHGDAAFAGQGVVAETLNLSQLEGYRTGGTVHLVVNNQIGFTTLPMHSRSSAYATDIARMIQAPIFHVNGDDPEAAVRVARLALDYRNVFNKDVVIDLVCYRKYGHNEGDEPSYTQPLMYADIGAHRSVRKLYLELLLRRGELTPEQAEEILDDFKSILDRAFEETKELAEKNKDRQPVAVAIETEDAAVETAAPRDALTHVMERLVTMPDNLQVHKKLARLVVDRRRQQFEEGTIDWAFAESLAFGTLLLEGTPVRLSGQDSGRGTFSQRHAILYDQEDGHRYLPLNHLTPGGPGDGQARFQVYDSLLSEYAALGFEYGYSVADPSALVLWEAQFGDFVNGAQIMIDQFITAAEAKWGQTSSLVMLLPHGYEGQGPEHSSGRLERFLQACAEDNLIVANYSTPANYFHALRRQVLRGAKKPLIVMTPKSLLRLPEAVTSVDELADGAYRPFIASEAPEADRLVICSGKVVYDALKAREALDRPSSVAVARLEQFYPFPEDDVREELARFEGKPVVWLQEEPANMGAWTFVQPRLDALREDLHGDCSHRVTYAGRPAAASPAAGSAKVHAAVQEQVLRAALGIEG